MIVKPRAVPSAPAPEPQPAQTITHNAPPVHVHAPITVHTDNRSTVDALKQQADQMQQLSQALEDLAAKMNPGVLNVTVTEWTSMGRIKTIRISRE